MAYVTAGTAVLAWGVAEYFAVQFADLIWVVIKAWGTKGDPLPPGIVIALTLPPLGFATTLCLSLSAIRHGRAKAAVWISAISLVLCTLVISTIVLIEHSK